MSTAAIDLANIPTDDLIGELIARRSRIDTALESARVWDTRQSPAIAHAAAAWGLSTGSLFRKTRQIKTVYARHMAMAILREDAFTVTEIAGIFGMDPSSVTFALRRHKENLECDPDYVRRWELAKSQQPERSAPDA